MPTVGGVITAGFIIVGHYDDSDKASMDEDSRQNSGYFPDFVSQQLRNPSINIPCGQRWRTGMPFLDTVITAVRCQHDVLHSGA